MYCDCIVCYPKLFLGNLVSNKMLLYGLNWPYILRAENIELLKKNSSWFAGYQIPIRLIFVDYLFLKIFLVSHHLALHLHLLSTPI